MGRHDEHMEFRNGLSVTGGNVNWGSGTINNSNFGSASSDRLAVGKSVHHLSFVAGTEETTAIGSGDHIVHAARGSGTIAAFSIYVQAIPDSNNSYAVKLHTCPDGSTTWTDVTTAVTIDDNSTAGAKNAATINTASYNADDRFQIQWVRTGSTGTEGQGITCVLHLEEATT